MPDNDKLVVAMVCHEVSNALSAILGWVRLAQSNPESLDEALPLIEASALNAETAISRLNERSTVRDDANSDVSLDRVLGHVLRLARAECESRNARVELELEEPFSVRGSMGSLFSVFWNLTKNALESQPEGTHVQITARRQGDHVSIEVADDGPGMTAEQRARCFTAHYTTKTRGTGLGLQVVAQTIERVGGQIRAEPIAPTGTRFIVELPIAARRTTRDAPITTSILVVDNDGPVRDLLETSLRLQGHQVTAVATPTEALATPGIFQIALIDLNLDESRGDRLAAELHQAGRIKRVALVSGMGPPTDLAFQPERWLRKPFELEELADLVAQLSAKS